MYTYIDRKLYTLVHQRKLCMPRGRKNFVQIFVTFTRKRTIMYFQNFLYTMSDTPISTIYMSSNQKQNCNSQVMVSFISNQKSSGYRIQTTLKCEKIAIFTPIKSEKWSDSFCKPWIQSNYQLPIKHPFMWKRNVLWIKPGIQKSIYRSCNMNLMTRPR